MDLYKYAEDGEHALNLLPLDVDKLRGWEHAERPQRRELKDGWQVTFGFLPYAIFVWFVLAVGVRACCKGIVWLAGLLGRL